jgi:hypothetical protein
MADGIKDVLDIAPLKKDAARVIMRALQGLKTRRVL